jgi:hypothetical protein
VAGGGAGEVDVRIERGVVMAYDSTDHEADVLVVGSMQRVLQAVPVSHQVGAELMAEGTAVCVVFFGEGDAGGLVVATFDGAPDAWVTEDLLTFSPATPAVEFESTSENQELTTSDEVYDCLEIEVTVPEGKTYGVLAIASVELRCSSYTNYVIDTVRIYHDSTGQGEPVGNRHNSNADRGAATVAHCGEITETTTISAQVSKSADRNTEIAGRGNLAVLYWEMTV